MPLLLKTSIKIMKTWLSFQLNSDFVAHCVFAQTFLYLVSREKLSKEMSQTDRIHLYFRFVSISVWRSNCVSNHCTFEPNYLE